MKHLVGGWSILEHLFVSQFYPIIFPKKDHFLLKRTADRQAIIVHVVSGRYLAGKKNVQMILSLQRKEAAENGTNIKIQDFKGK